MLLKAPETAQAQPKGQLKNNNKKQNNGKLRNGRNGQNNRPQGSGQNQNLPAPQSRDDAFQQAPVPRFRSPSPGYAPQSKRPQSPQYDDRLFRLSEVTNTVSLQTSFTIFCQWFLPHSVSKQEPVTVPNLLARKKHVRSIQKSTTYQISWQTFEPSKSSTTSFSF